MKGEEKGVQHNKYKWLLHKTMSKFFEGYLGIP